MVSLKKKKIGIVSFRMRQVVGTIPVAVYTTNDEHRFESLPSFLFVSSRSNGIFNHLNLR
jgi:hypothetical protein